MNPLADANQFSANPFVILTLIVAPAILTNAAALMIMSTSNRFARAVDRGRDLFFRFIWLDEVTTKSFSNHTPKEKKHE
jgi:hypothetical protein